MQFFAYYNNDYGIYLGTHDPKASSKKFITKTIDNGILFENIIPIPNKSKPGNDWEMSGTFQFEVFEGDWFEASQIYKNWASQEAEYWPIETVKRTQRQNVLGNIGAWIYYSDINESDSLIKNTVKSFADYINVPVAMHWYQWNNKEFDDGYPVYFPERPGLTNLVNEIHQLGDIYLMPYINGRLYDTDLPNYSSNGYPHATKKADGNIFSQDFSGNHFAVMCPTQEPWQNILVDASKQLTTRIGMDGIYLDQVCASSVPECMDTTHNHPLGGGNWWREGYNEMFEKVHNSLADNKFTIVEGGCDYLADEVDGFLVGGWTTDNLVPAFQYVYAGKLQLISNNTGTSTYNNQSFYCKLSQSFVFGVQPGRFSSWMVFDVNATTAKLFVKQIATMRHKLKSFVSFGRMLKPLKINKTISDITSTWYDYGKPVEVTISALQSSTWKNKQNDKVAVIFANASMKETLQFPFEFEGSLYELDGKLKVQKIIESNNKDFTEEENSFSKKVLLAPMQIIAFVISQDSLTDVSDKEEKSPSKFLLFQNYPNPFNPTTIIEYTIPVLEALHATSQQIQVKVYDILGREVTTLVNKKQKPGSYKVQFNATNFTSGIYFYKLKVGKFIKTRKMVLVK